MSKYKCKEGMIDNRIVNDNHQGGIERVLQKRGDKKDVEGHNGKMGKASNKAHWRRSGDSLTPRKA